MREKRLFLLIFIILALCISACGKSANKIMESVDNKPSESGAKEFAISSYKDTYGIDVNLIDCNYENEILTCKIKNGFDYYDTYVGHNGRNYYMYTTYGKDEWKKIVPHFQNYNEFHISSFYWGDEGRVAYINVRTDEAFDKIANILYELGDDSEITTDGSVEFVYLGNVVSIPYTHGRHDYSAEDYKDMLNDLYMTVSTIPKENSDAVMLIASNHNYGLVCNDEDFWSSTTYEVKYDGTLTVTSNYNLSGSASSSYMLTDYEYSILRSTLEKDFDGREVNVDACDGDGWAMTHYDKNGKEIHSINGYIYGDYVCEDIISGILEKYR